MPHFFNPETVRAPASRYSHGASHALSGRRLVISGQIGIDREGNIPKSLEAQLEIAFSNIIAILHAADMRIEELVKITAFCTVPGGVGAFRTAREAALPGHAPATTYLEVAGLAAPQFLIEIEAEAVSDGA